MQKNLFLIEVENKKNIRKFLEFPSTLYQDDTNWIRPLDEDVERVFNPKKNKFFKKGESVRWIIQNENDEVIGKIAAFYTKKTNVKVGAMAVGGCGFFDCVNDSDVANMLFNAAKDWLINRGMDAMDGPINFGSRENFWGCLSEGFYEPIYKMPYNYKYYNKLFENYGFKNYFNQLTFHLPLTPGGVDPIIISKASIIRKDPNITFGFYDKKNSSSVARNFMDVFNAAWDSFEGVKQITLAQSNALFKSMRKIIDPKLIIFAYHNKKPIAFFIMIPDLYQIMRKFNGNFNVVNKLRLMYDLKVRKLCTRAVGLIFGVIPEFQGRGVAEGMIMHFEDEVAEGVNYSDLEMNWIGDFNPKMIKLVKQIGGKVRKIHITYRYIFDRTLPFERAKNV